MTTNFDADIIQRILRRKRTMRRLLLSIAGLLLLPPLIGLHFYAVVMFFAETLEFGPNGALMWLAAMLCLFSWGAVGLLVVDHFHTQK